MTDLHKAAQQALEALEWHYRQGHSNTLGGFRLKIDEKALRNLRVALAQQQAGSWQDGVLEGHLRERERWLAQEQAEPVQEPVAWMCPEDPERETAFNWKAGHCENCGKQRIPLYTAPPQRKPLSLTDLQEALVLTNLIDRDAIEDPEEYDEGSTLAQIDELHRIIKERV